MTVSDVPVTPGSGANIATYSFTDTDSVSKQIQRITANDSTGAEIIGLKTDAAATQTDATALSLMQVFKQISKTLQAAAASMAGLLYVRLTDGTTSLPILAASSGPPAATVPAVPVSIRDVNANGRNTPANSAPVVLNSMIYKTVAASQTAQVLQSSAGAAGDYLDGLLVVPATTAAGAVSITDGSGAAITVFPGGGTTALSNLVPFFIPIGAISSSGAWKVTTGANVSVVAVGNFS